MGGRFLSTEPCVGVLVRIKNLMKTPAQYDTLKKELIKEEGCTFSASETLGKVLNEELDVYGLKFTTYPEYRFEDDLILLHHRLIIMNKVDEFDDKNGLQEYHESTNNWIHEYDSRYLSNAHPLPIMSEDTRQRINQYLESKGIDYTKQPSALINLNHI